MMRVGILGGGIAGLSVAHYLGRSGHTPVVLEPVGELGGSAAQFGCAGLSVDRHFHSLSDADTALCGLLAEIGALGQVVWRPTRRAIFMEGAQYGLGRPTDLMRIPDLTLAEKLRGVLAGAYATRLKRYGLHLDAIPAQRWLREVFGDVIYERIWQPAMESRFGEHAAEVPAYWAWRSLNMHLSGRSEVSGYVNGGTRGLTQHIRDSIERAGGEVRLNADITAIDTEDKRPVVVVDRAEERFDALVCTLPMPLLHKLAQGALAAQLPDELVYQGLVSAAVIARRPLSNYHVTEVLDGSFPFHSIAEATHVLPTQTLGGRHLFYLSRYCGPQSEAYRLGDDVVKKQAIEGLVGHFPHFSMDDVEDVVISRKPFAEPLCTVGHLKRRCELRVGDSDVYLCTSDQIYPRVPGWNSSVAFAREVSARVVSNLAR